jgi:hypothetical protein
MKALMNVIEHPCRKKRIAEAKSKILKSLYRVDLPRGLVGQSWEELLTTALVYELEIPGSGVAALRRALACHLKSPKGGERAA